MLFNRNIKYRDIIFVMMIIVVGYILIDNYAYIFPLIKSFLSIVSPFVYALIIAYCLNPLMMVFEKRLKLKRELSVPLTYFTVIGLIVLLFIYIVPSVITMTAEFPRYLEVIQGWANSIITNDNIQTYLEDLDFLNFLALSPAQLGTILVDVAEKIISSIFFATTGLLKVLVGFVISIYVLIDKEKFSKGSKVVVYMLLKEERGNRFLEWVRIYDKMVGLYIGIKALDSAIIALIAFVGLLIMGAPFPVLLALIVGITNMVPYVGPLVGEIIGVFIGFFVSPMMALTIFIFLFTLQQFDAWYLDPKLIGGRVGVRPFFIILALIIGGGYFGLIGMLLSSPTVATLKIYYDRKVAVFMAKNNRIAKNIDGSA
jgi:predicted PurR-regulated permease PerM